MQEITRGFILIAEYRNRLADAEKAPMYFATGYNQDGEPYDIQENLAPWEAVDKAAHAIAQSEAAREILQAHNLTVEGTAITNRAGTYVRSREIPIFLKEKNK